MFFLSYHMEWKINFDLNFLILATLLNVIGLITNGFSLFSIVTSFDLRRSVYFLMLIDSLMSFLCSFCYGIVFFMSVIVNVANPLLFCLLFMAFPYTAMLFGFAFSALIAAIR